MASPTDAQVTDLMNTATARLFRRALAGAWKRPSVFWFLLKAMRGQARAAGKRKRFEAQGIHVPAFMIISLTRQCNLTCKGCYANLQFDPDAQEMDVTRFRQVLSQAQELGVSIILLGGGEPFLRPDFLHAASEFPQIMFPVFTNGSLLDPGWIHFLKKNRNMIPIVSIEGFETLNDERRGQGAFRQVQATLRALKKGGVFTGASLTYTRQNVEELSSIPFLTKMRESGASLFFFVEYVPVQPDTEDLLPTQAQREKLRGALHDLESRFSALFIAFPGDEEEFGGCLSAGRGFVHVNPAAQVEPCPFAPFSDVDLNKVSLQEALQSKLLRTIRENHDQLDETSGGCALFAKRDWLRSLVRGKSCD